MEDAPSFFAKRVKIGGGRGGGGLIAEEHQEIKVAIVESQRPEGSRKEEDRKVGEELNKKAEEGDEEEEEGEGGSGSGSKESSSRKRRRNETEEDEEGE